jgi:hypothetical protein
LNRREFCQASIARTAAAALAGGVFFRECSNVAARPTGSAAGSPSPTPAGSTTSSKVPDLGVGANLNGKQVFPFDNPWNTDISQASVDPNSDKLIQSIGLSNSLHPDFGTTYAGQPWGIPYEVVSGKQKLVAVTFDYADESDPGPYPIPADAPIEGGSDSTGDRHVLVIDRDNWLLYEMFNATVNSKGNWHAGSGAVFDLTSNKLRPAGWTSADAAGLPIFPGLVRYEEVAINKVITHALRFTVRHTRKAYVSPARHYASSNRSASLPPMGMRVRLKATVDISKFSKANQVILKALKKYGMMVADNGGNWFLSGAPDSRWNDSDINNLKKVKGSDFEVVKMGKITVG